MAEIKEVFEVIGYFLLLDKQGGFFWFHGTVLLKRESFLVFILTQEGHLRSRRFSCYEESSLFPSSSWLQTIVSSSVTQLQSRATENFLKPFVVSQASSIISKGIHHANTSLVSPKDLKLLWLKNDVKTPPKTQVFKVSSSRLTRLIEESKPWEELKPWRCTW